jgi:hypothetical protein
MNRWKWVLLLVVLSVGCWACGLAAQDVSLLQDERALLQSSYLEGDGGTVPKVIAKVGYCEVNQVLKDIGKDDAGLTDAGVIACPDGGK